MVMSKRRELCPWLLHTQEQPGRISLGIREKKICEKKIPAVESCSLLLPCVLGLWLRQQLWL